MKKKFIYILFSAFLSCSKTSEPCYQTWKVSEYCATSSGCNVVGCQTAITKEFKYKCEDVANVKENDLVLYRTDGCAKFYRRYLNRIN